MSKIICKRCDADCSARKHTQVEGDITTLLEIITHRDGVKEKRIYGRINNKTNEILSFNPILTHTVEVR